MTAGEKLLDAHEVAEMLAVKVSWVREATRSGAMPSVRLGKYRRYNRSEVLAWLDSCKQPGRPITMRGPKGSDR